MQLVFSIFALIVAALLCFWMAGNIISVLLGAPALSSPSSDGWKKYADKHKTFLDLGSGSGEMCLRAAPYFKHVYGIEGSPWYYLLSRYKCRKEENITILFGDFYRLKWPRVDYIYCYLMDSPVKRLKPFLERSGAIVLSLSFSIEDWKEIERIKKDNRTLYVYDCQKVL